MKGRRNPLVELAGAPLPDENSVESIARIEIQQPGLDFLLPFPLVRFCAPGTLGQFAALQSTRQGTTEDVLCGKRCGKTQGAFLTSLGNSLSF